MNKVAKKAKQLVPFTSLLVFFSLMVINARAQTAADNEAATREISTAMNNSSKAWNEVNLDAFMSLYDASATMMMTRGSVGLDSIRYLYEKHYFKGSMPKQNLRYSDMKVRLLGNDHALLTGAFTL